MESIYVCMDVWKKKKERQHRYHRLFSFILYSLLANRSSCLLLPSAIDTFNVQNRLVHIMNFIIKFSFLNHPTFHCLKNIYTILLFTERDEHVFTIWFFAIVVVNVPSFKSPFFRKTNKNGYNRIGTNKIHKASLEIK